MPRPALASETISETFRVDVSARGARLIDFSRPISADGVTADVKQILSDGLRSFRFERLQELPFFLCCHATVNPGSVSTWDDYRPSPNALRELIVRLIEQGARNGDIHRGVAEALFGMDSETADLRLEGRQIVAGRRHDPKNPIGQHGIRKKPYGKQWKTVAYIATELIDSEKRARQIALDPSIATSGSTIGGVVDPQPRSAPAFLPESEWEQAAGYRWRSYERLLVCSHDFSMLTYRTTVYIFISVPHSRLYVHQRAPEADTGSLGEPVISSIETPNSSPAQYVGTVQHSARHPQWLLDYFDFGPGTQYGDELCLVFEHTYRSARRSCPLHVIATPEFDGLEDFELRAEREAADGSSTELLNEPLIAYRPPRGRQQVLFVQPRREFEKYELRDEADWPRVRELQTRIDNLEEELGELDDAYRSYFEARDAEDLDKKE